jgi:hypothetical protein
VPHPDDFGRPCEHRTDISAELPPVERVIELAGRPVAPLVGGDCHAAHSQIGDSRYDRPPHFLAETGCVDEQDSGPSPIERFLAERNANGAVYDLALAEHRSL